MAFVKAVVICAHQHQPEVCALVANVDMQHELLRAPWNANWCPGLTALHRRIRHYEVEYHRYVWKVELSDQGYERNGNLPCGLMLSNSSVNTVITLSAVTIIPNLSQLKTEINLRKLLRLLNLSNYIIEDRSYRHREPQRLECLQQALGTS
jgi:hypothetical protein